MKLKNSYHTYALITIVGWSFALVLTRFLSQDFTAFSIGFLRNFIASCILIITVILTRMKVPHKSDILMFFASGAFGFFFCTIAFNKGLAMVTSATASVVIAIVPVATALLAKFIFKESLHFLQWIAIVIEFIGVVILATMNEEFSINTGLFWLLLVVLTFSIYNLFQRKLTQTYSALQSSSYSIFFGTILLSIFLPNSVREISAASGKQIFYFLILGVFSSAISYISWAKAFSIADRASQVSNYMFVSPFLTSILGYLFLQEVPDKATILGGTVIIFGLFLFNFGWKIYDHICKKKVCLR